MEFTNWLNSKLPSIAEEVEKELKKNGEIDSDEGLDFTGRKDIYEILDELLAVLFPQSYSKEKLNPSELNFFLCDTLRHISIKLKNHIKNVLVYRCPEKECGSCDCEKKAEESVKHFIESLPEIKRMLMLDVEAALKGDPAALDREEIILSYPCIEAITTYRIAHQLYKLKIPVIPRIMTERAHSLTGIDIHPGAEIGKCFFIDHGTGVVIGETTRIGNNVKIYQGVTLGALSPFDKEGKPRKGQKRHPDIEDDVIIYANATILGGKTIIGKGAVIGGNTWITESVPPGAHVYNREHIEAMKERTKKE